MHGLRMVSFPYYPVISTTCIQYKSVVKLPYSAKRKSIELPRISMEKQCMVSGEKFDEPLLPNINVLHDNQIASYVLSLLSHIN